MKRCSGLAEPSRQRLIRKVVSTMKSVPSLLDEPVPFAQYGGNLRVRLGFLNAAPGNA